MVSRTITSAKPTHSKGQVSSDTPLKISWIYDESPGGKLGLTMCPGKNLAKGRDGKTYQRDIAKDVLSLKERNVNMIVCLLNDYEVRSIGCNHIKY
jgi:hypothetical protein